MTKNMARIEIITPQTSSKSYDLSPAIDTEHLPKHGIEHTTGYAAHLIQCTKKINNKL